MIKMFLLIIGAMILSSSCGLAQNGYPAILNSDGGKISPEYTTFQLTPRIYTEGEMLSIGFDFEGNTVCFDSKHRDRICSKELSDKWPKVTVPKELILDPSKKYTDEEKQQLIEKGRVWDDEAYKKYLVPYYAEVEKGPLLSFDAIAVDSNGIEIPLVYAGTGAGYCREQTDQYCSQFDLPRENGVITGTVKTLAGRTIKSLKIKILEGNIKITNIYAVGPYKRAFG